MYEFYTPTEENIEALHNVIEHYINTLKIKENTKFEMGLIYKDNCHIGIIIFDNENTVIYNYETNGWRFYLVNEDDDKTISIISSGKKYIFLPEGTRVIADLNTGQQEAFGYNELDNNYYYLEATNYNNHELTTTYYYSHEYALDDEHLLGIKKFMDDQLLAVYAKASSIPGTFSHVKVQAYESANIFDFLTKLGSLDNTTPGFKHTIFGYYPMASQEHYVRVDKPSIISSIKYKPVMSKEEFLIRYGSPNINQEVIDLYHNRNQRIQNILDIYHQFEKLTQADDQKLEKTL